MTNNETLQAAWEFIAQPDKKYAYFANDGSYGNAEGIVVVDVTNWIDEDWNEDIEYASDMTRAQAARDISFKRGGVRPAIEDTKNAMVWDRNVLADNGYFLSDEEWFNFTHMLNKVAQDFFEERDLELEERDLENN